MKKKKDMDIIDNFLDQDEFDELQRMMLHNDFPWYFNDEIVSDTDNHGAFQFVHMFYDGYRPFSQNYINLTPISVKLKPCAIIRIKANLHPRTREIEVHEFHVDFDPVKLTHTTSIFYVNTNNGYTIFEDGTKVESVANRMITFPGNMKHTGTSCTDEQTRVIINFNYF